jgi:hypothetical protein
MAIQTEEEAYWYLHLTGQSSAKAKHLCKTSVPCCLLEKTRVFRVLCRGLLPHCISLSCRCTKSRAGSVQEGIGAEVSVGHRQWEAVLFIVLWWMMVLHDGRESL